MKYHVLEDAKQFSLQLLVKIPEYRLVLGKAMFDIE